MGSHGIAPWGPSPRRRVSPLPVPGGVAEKGGSVPFTYQKPENSRKNLGKFFPKKGLSIYDRRFK